MLLHRYNGNVILLTKNYFSIVVNVQKRNIQHPEMSKIQIFWCPGLNPTNNFFQISEKFS